jgi:hypothetical protein
MALGLAHVAIWIPWSVDFSVQRTAALFSRATWQFIAAESGDEGFQ